MVRESDSLSSMHKKNYPVKIIRGTLVSNAKSVSADWEREALQQAFADNGLQEFFNDGEWAYGGIKFNSHSAIKGKGINDGVGKHVAAKEGKKFAQALSRVMQTEVAKELNISAYFILNIDTGMEPVVIHVDIEDGQVSYQQAVHTLSEPVFISS